VGIRAVDDQGNVGQVAVLGKGAKKKAKRKLRLTVSPARVRAGHRTRFRFRVTSAGKPVRRATIRFAGKRVRTDKRGRASVVAVLRHRGHRPAVASRSGYRTARRLVAVRGRVSTRFTG
jgi:hypothetical protein